MSKELHKLLADGPAMDRLEKHLQACKKLGFVEVDLGGVVYRAAPEVPAWMKPKVKDAPDSADPYDDEDLYP